MKRALIQGNRICDIVTVDDEFPVHEDLVWVDVSDDTTDADTWVDGAVIKAPVPTPLEEWESLVGNTDQHVPRFIEDIYDALQEDAQARVPQIMRDRITAKKTLRGEKP